METKYLSAKQVAEYFGVTKATVLNWEKRRLISCLHVGITRRFALSDIQTFENTYYRKAMIDE